MEGNEEEGGSGTRAKGEWPEVGAMVPDMLRWGDAGCAVSWEEEERGRREDPSCALGLGPHLDLDDDGADVDENE